MACSAGALGKCPGLQINSVGSYHQRLTWDPPPTLNITVVEPDIFSYIVCSNINNKCTTIDVRDPGDDTSDLQQYTFLNLRAYINFTVTAVNIVGDGESAGILYEPCEHTGGGMYCECSTMCTGFLNLFFFHCLLGSGKRKKDMSKVLCLVDYHVQITLVSLTSIPVPEMFAVTDISTVVTFGSNNTPSLLVEVMVSSHSPTSFELNY